MRQELEALVAQWRADADRITPASEHNRGVILALRACAFDVESVLRGVR